MCQAHFELFSRDTLYDRLTHHTRMPPTSHTHREPTPISTLTHTRPPPHTHRYTPSPPGA